MLHNRKPDWRKSDQKTRFGGWSIHAQILWSLKKYTNSFYSITKMPESRFARGMYYIRYVMNSVFSCPEVNEAFVGARFACALNVFWDNPHLCRSFTFRYWQQTAYNRNYTIDIVGSTRMIRTKRDSYYLGIDENRNEVMRNARKSLCNPDNDQFWLSRNILRHRPRSTIFRAITSSDDWVTVNGPL